MSDADRDDLDDLDDIARRNLFGLLAGEIPHPGDWEYDEDEANATGDLFGVGDADTE